MATVRAQSDDEELAKFQFYNGYSYPLDIYLLDENQDPPEEQYQVTVPNVVIQPGRPGQVGRILRGQEALAVDFYPGTRFRLKLHRQKNSGWETKGTALPERPAPDALTLYDIPTAPGGTYTHSASPGNYLQSRLVPGTEVVLLSKNGCLLIDDNINEHGTKSRNGYHVRRDAGLFDSVSEEKHYRWTVRPAQNGRPDMFSLELVRSF